MYIGVESGTNRNLDHTFPIRLPNALKVSFASLMRSPLLIEGRTDGVDACANFDDSRLKSSSAVFSPFSERV